MKILPLIDYNIYIGTDIWQMLQAYITKGNYAKVLVIVDENTRKHCLPIFQQHNTTPIHIIEIKSGETHKNIETCQQIWQQMMAYRAGRKSLTINLGGGVIGDMGGFCASTFKRGMDFIQMPTTLLAQVDASIGGKLGIDFQAIKNSIGLFRNPKAVFINPLFLKTLSSREVRSGFAELIKHSLIQDKAQWEQLSKITDLTAIDWATYLLPSLKIKQHIVQIDPFEKGLRKALNFGHTIGHAIEGILLPTENRLLHGEAIAIGMICESYLSTQLTGLSETALQKICDFILKIYGKIDLNPTHYESFIKMMLQDKKNIGGRINFSLLKATGEVIVNQTTEHARIIDALNFYRHLPVV